MSNALDEIPQKAQDFKKQCQEMLYEAVANKIEKELNNPNPVTSQQQDNKKDSSKKKSVCRAWIGAGASLLLLGVYGGLIACIIKYLFTDNDISCYKKLPLISYNETIILIFILVLTTIVLIMSGIFILRFMRCCNEICVFESENKDASSKKSESSMTEVMIKRIQDAVFNEVVDDTIKAFKDKKKC